MCTNQFIYFSNYRSKETDINFKIKKKYTKTFRILIQKQWMPFKKTKMIKKIPQIKKGKNSFFPLKYSYIILF